LLRQIMKSWLSKFTKRVGTKNVTGKKNEKAEAMKTLSNVNPENAFLFSTSEGSYTGKSAQNLYNLCDVLKTIDLRSVEFHLRRGDFENWIKYLGDDTLALQLTEIRNMPFDGERTRVRIVEAISKRIEKLKTESSS
jgi:hypothetical protein